MHASTKETQPHVHPTTHDRPPDRSISPRRRYRRRYRGTVPRPGPQEGRHPVAIYERDRTRTDGLQGYRVGIDPDGSRALNECLPPDLYDTFFATCARTPRFSNNILTEQLSEVLSLEERPNTDPVNSEKSVSRMTLTQVLLTGLEDVVHFDKTFTHCEQHPDGTVTAYFEDGTSATS